MEKKELSYTTDGNVDWYGHYGKQYGSSLKNYKQNCHERDNEICPVVFNSPGNSPGQNTGVGSLSLLQ